MKQNKELGSAHLAIIIILVLAVVGLLGYMAYDKFINNNNIGGTVVPADKPEEKTPVVEPETVVDNFVKGYFIKLSDSSKFIKNSDLLTQKFKDYYAQATGHGLDPITRTQDWPFVGDDWGETIIGDSVITGNQAEVPFGCRIYDGYDEDNNMCDDGVNFNSFLLVISDNNWKIDSLTKPLVITQGN